LAAVAVSRGSEREAVRLLGLADAIMAEHGLQLEPFVRDLVAQTESTARAAVGDEEYERLHADGASLDPEEAIDRLLASS
jgi:hypothetical protein